MGNVDKIEDQIRMAKMPSLAQKEERVGKDKSDTLEYFEIPAEEDFNRLALSVSSGSPMDPLPHRVWKELKEELFPQIQQICYQSLSSGVVPAFWKQAIVTPLLKKATLDPLCPKKQSVWLAKHSILRN